MEKGSIVLKYGGLKLTGRRSVPISHRFDLSRSLKVKENRAKWNFIYDFLYVNNGN